MAIHICLFSTLPYSIKQRTVSPHHPSNPHLFTIQHVARAQSTPTPRFSYIQTATRLCQINSNKVCGPATLKYHSARYNSTIQSFNVARIFSSRIGKVCVLAADKFTLIRFGMRQCLNKFRISYIYIYVILVESMRLAENDDTDVLLSRV